MHPEQQLQACCASTQARPNGCTPSRAVPTSLPALHSPFCLSPHLPLPPLPPPLLQMRPVFSKHRNLVIKPGERSKDYTQPEGGAGAPGAAAAAAAGGAGAPGGAAPAAEGSWSAMVPGGAAPAAQQQQAQQQQQQQEVIVTGGLGGLRAALLAYRDAGLLELLEPRLPHL